ncbi:hypothetical protein [uncultured Anaerococcus sp.]|uniref:hypothetical protein n=1 Tax=uncultured Anaerococcus sp. TaxID=293428 RepID=UPI002805E6D0|nr:hypothetical protein [uncultured Anaerococcus sp.]
MNRDLRTYILAEKIALTESFNMMVYGIRKLPLIGKKLGDKYRFFEFKEIMYSFYPIFVLIKQILGCALSFLIAYLYTTITYGWIYKIFGGEIFAADLASKAELTSYLMGLMIPVILYFATGIFRNFIYDSGPGIGKYFAQYHIDPASSYKMFLYYKPAMRLIGRTLIFAIFFSLINKIPLIYPILMSFAVYFLEIGASVFWMKYKLKHKKGILDNGLLQVAFILLTYLAVMGLVITGRFDLRITTGIIFIFSLALFIYGVSSLKCFKSFDQVIEESVEEYNVGGEELGLSEAKNYELKDKDIEVKNKKGLYQKKGLAFLNSLFFIRHKRLIKKPVIIKSLAVPAIGLGVFFFTVFKKTLGAEDIFELTIRAMPFLMYTLSRQDKVITAMYLNCDQGLLPYGFYRKGEMLLAMYRLRFRSMLAINLIPAAAVFATYMAAVAYKGELLWVKNLVVLAYILLMTTFFTSLALAKYYLLQPYNQEGMAVSKLAGVINMVVYYICIYGAFIVKDMDYKMILLASGGFILAFIIVVNILIVKFGSKTFKIRD